MHAFNTILNWFSGNSLPLKCNKTQCYFTQETTLKPVILDVYMFNEAEGTKLLGLLKWKEHVKVISTTYAMIQKLKIIFYFRVTTQLWIKSL